MVDPQREARRHQLAALIRDYFADDNDYVEGVLRQSTGRKLTVRSIQTWLAPGNLVSSRNTPEWALRALQEYVDRSENGPHMKARAEREREHRRANPAGPREHGHDVRARRAVEQADHELSEERAQLQTLQDAGGRALGEALHKLILPIQRQLRYEASVNSMLIAAIRASNHDDLKRYVDDAMMGDLVSGNAIRKAKIALENGTDEFSNADGLPSDAAED